MSALDLGPYPTAAGFEEAVMLDGDDPLGDFRSRYVFDDPELIYLDGNSLGRLPHRALEIVERVVERQWGDRLIRSWNEGWWELQLALGDRLAPLVGASAGEVIISDSTSVNLYKLAVAAMRSRPERSKLITDDLNFPSDIYVLRGVAEACGAELAILPSDGTSGPLDRLERSLDRETALVSLSHTVFTPPIPAYGGFPSGRYWT